VDAHSHIHSSALTYSLSEPDQPTYSHYVFAELISPADTLVSRVMISLTDDNMYHGYLPLSKNIPEGNYTLRAYTRYMENMGDEYFFKKNIRISNISFVKNQQQQEVV